MADITVIDVVDFLRQRGVEENVLDEFQKQKIDGLALTSMTDRHFDQLGLLRMGDRLALRAFCAPKKDDNFDDKVERLKEALNGRGKRQGDQSVAVGGTGRNKRSLKPTLKVEFGWKHFSSGKYMQVKKSKGGGTRSVDMNRTAQYDECLQKAQELFFPKQTSQFGKLTDMTDSHLANYNGERITKEGFTVASYKQETGMSLPRLYFVTKRAKRGVHLKTPSPNNHSSSSSAEIAIGQVMEIPEELPVNFMQDDDCYQCGLSSLIATEESLIQSRVAWCSDQMSKLEEPPLTEPHIMSVIFPTKFIRSTQSRTFKQTAVVKDLYSWIGTFHSVPAHFSIVLDKGRILKDLSLPLCQIGNHIAIKVLQIPPDVIRGNEDIISSELICTCVICKAGLLPDEMVARPNQCFHIFHHTCIDEWLKVDEEGGMACPICEKSFKIIIVCSTMDESAKKICVSESMDNHEAEAQKLVFEDYIDNGQDSAKLNEARAKEWESLSESTITHASVNRDTIVEDILQLYRMNETLTSTPLEVTFLNEPAEDADGLTRELFSQGWKNILPLFFEGTNFHVPRVDPDCTEELFEILGRLGSHGFVLTGYFPVEIAPASLIGIFDPDALSDKDLIYSFLSFLTEGEHAAAEKAMEKSKVSVDDILVDILSRYNVRQIPTSRSEFHSLFVRIAKCEFVKRGLEKAHPAIWKAINASDIRALYVRLYPTAEKLVELLEPSDEYMPLNSRRDRVFEFLRRYVRSLSKEKVPSFLQFVTGTSLALVPHITVAFTDLSGIQRRPIVHTCTSRVDVSTEYESFSAFCREFDTVICKEECFRYNSV